MQDIEEKNNASIWGEYGDEMSAISNLEVQALVDDELAEPRRSEVLACMTADRKLRYKYELLCHQRDLLRMWWSSAARTGSAS